MHKACPPFWHQPAMRRAAGDTLRPGGFHLTDHAISLIGLKPGWRVVDVGCGLGATVSRLRSRFGADAVGVDRSFLSRSQLCANIPVVGGEGENLPFSTGFFDAVFCECVLSLFACPEAGIREFFRVLKQRGFLVISDLTTNTDVTRETNSCATGALSVQKIQKLLESNGFTLVTREEHSQYLKDLAVQLAWEGHRHEPCRCGEQKRGYHLLIAQRKGEADAD